MMLRYSLFIAILAASLFPFSAVAQSTPPGEAAVDGENGTFCNVFYVKSDDLNQLPFDNVCFVADEYTMEDVKHMRCVGPIEGPIDLFRAYPWALHFYLPNVKDKDRLEVTLPKDLSKGDWKMEDGTFALTISNNRQFDRYVDVKDRVSFAAVGGWARVTDYTPQTGAMSYPEYELQMDLKVKAVENLEGKDVPVGKDIRLRMVIRIEALD